MENESTHRFDCQRDFFHHSHAVPGRQGALRVFSAGAVPSPSPHPAHSPGALSRRSHPAHSPRRADRKSKLLAPFHIITVPILRADQTPHRSPEHQHPELLEKETKKKTRFSVVSSSNRRMIQIDERTNGAIRNSSLGDSVRYDSVCCYELGTGD